MRLTPRQSSVVAAVDALTRSKGYPPTTREIAQKANLSETRVRVHLGRLEQLGVIAREPRVARSTRVLPR